MGRRLSAGKKKFVVLGDRDLAMFRWVSEQKFATKEQLTKRFFPKSNETLRTRPDRVCYRRLLELTHFDLLESRRLPVGGLPLYLVSRAAVRELAQTDSSPLPYLGHIDMRTFEHDRRSTDVRVAVEARGVLDWTSERRLLHAAWAGHVPDAVFTTGGARVALEMEVSLKRRDRYPDIFRSYDEWHPDVAIVWYLCDSMAILTTVAQEAQRVAPPGRIYVSLWQDFITHGPRAVMVSGQARLTLADLAA